MGALSDAIRDEIDAQMSAIVGAPYDDLGGAMKDALFTAIGAAMEANKDDFGTAPTGYTGTFLTGDGKTATVENGIIVSVA